MRSFSISCLYAAMVAVVLWSVGTAHAQSGGSSGSIGGMVLDPSGAVVANATVVIHQAVSGYARTAVTDEKGSFTFPNVPFNPYHLTVTAPGFAVAAQDVEVRSVVPGVVRINLQLPGSNTTVTVEAGADLVENDSTFHTDVDKQLFDKLPLESASSSLSSLVTLSTPGVAADSNGLFHGLGDHAENSFSVDGQPITDQQSKVFSNQVPLDSIQSMEVISGAPPAEYGGKTSVVIVATTRSGQGETTPHGSVTASYGAFGTSDGAANLAYGGAKWGNFISVGGLNSGRFLDPPEFVVMHDKGNEENLFDRVDYQLTTADSLHFNFGFTRSWFQTPNSFDSQYATPWNGVVVANGGLDPTGSGVGPADQRSQIKTFNIAPTWTRLLSNTTVFTLGAFVRRDAYNYYPSNDPFADLGAPGLQGETVGQRRTLTNAGLRSDVAYVKGIHNVKAGATYEQTFLDEKDPFGIVDPTLNAPCLDANGLPVFVGNPGLNDPVQCAGAATTSQSLYPAPFTANANFNALLGCYDLTRAVPSPNDGCPNTTSGLYTFNGHTDVKELALYLQDTISKGNWSLNLGVRGDLYNGLTVHREAEPRLGVAYNVKRTNSVLRVSYARTMESPFNENLVLSNIGCGNPVLNPLLACTGTSTNPFSPGWRNEFHAGVQQAFGKYVVFSGEYIWKYTHNAYDFSVLGATPITFPIEWSSSKIPGYAGRVSVPDVHGLSALVVFSSVAARFFTPQIGGAGAVPSAVGPFRIDHDEKFNMTSHLQYQPWKKGPWVGFNWRYDSGLVAGPAPCAGGADCANGTAGTDTVVDTSGLSADQQFQAGLFCGSLHAAHPTPGNPLGTPLSSSLGANLCPASQYGSTLLQIPAPGTENDDHNPPRIASRNLFDLSLGDDDLFRGERYKWSARLTAINLTNHYALYNFLSTFSGTHYVTPRALTAEVGFHF
jgi:hypothetical protein